MREGGVLNLSSLAIAGIAWCEKGGPKPLTFSNISDLTPKTRAYNCLQMVKLRTNRKESMGEYNWKVPDCEVLVGVTHKGMILKENCQRGRSYYLKNVTPLR